MYLGGKEMRRPKGPAKLKGILEKRDAILSKWRDGRIFARSVLIRILRANYQFFRYRHIKSSRVFIRPKKIKRY